MKNKNNKKLKKIHHEFNVSPLTLSLNFPGYTSKELAELIGIKKPIEAICLFEGFTFSFFTNEERWAEIGGLLGERAEKDYGFFLGLVRKSNRLKQETIKEIQKTTKERIVNLNSRRITFLLKKLSSNAYYLSVYSELAPVADHHHNIFSNKMEDIIKRTRGLPKTKQSVQEIVSILSTPTWDYPSDQAKKEKLLDNYLARWHWLSHGHLGPGLNKKELNKEFNKIRRTKVNSTKTNLKNKQKKLVKQLSLSKKEQDIFQVAQIFIYLRGMRAEVCNGVFAILNQIAERMSLETKIKKDFLMFCSISEIIDYFRGKFLPSVDALKKRKKYSVWLAKNVFNIRILSGQKAKEYIKKHAISDNESDLKQDEIFGKVAFPGRIKGMAKIVNTPKEMNKIKPGDILVSTQTTPELLPAMKKAAAFITDIGGITSHAAIVSRELKIPCIVGTKVATKVLKDGDKVEVDANKGIIKIL